MSTNARITPWYTRRRTRSVGSAPFVWPQMQHLTANSTLSDEICSSSSPKDKDCSNFYQSDSDDICGSICHDVAYNATATSNVAAAAAMANCSVPQTLESDSFNENSPCRRSTRRKRKYKKIAAMEVDITAPVNRFYHPCSSTLLHAKKKRIMRISSSYIQNDRLWMSSEKRKRSLREKSRLSLDGSGIGISSDELSSVNRDAKVLGIGKLSLNDNPKQVEKEKEEEVEQYDSMEVSYPVTALSSSSVSSSGSETGIFTNDEGREADDEQSDWVGDIGLAAAASLAVHNADVVVDDDGDEEDEDDDVETSYLIGSQNKMTDDVSNCLMVPPCSSKVVANLFFANKLPSSDCINRSTRRKIRLLKTQPQPVQMLRPNATIAEFQNHDSDFGNDTKITAVSRRHTFSSYKRRKRIPTQGVLTTVINPTVSEKASQLFPATGQKLSDISSSDSKDSTL